MSLPKKWADYSKIFSSHFLCFHQWNKGELYLKLLGTWREVPKKEKWACPKNGQTTQKYFPVIFTASSNGKKENVRTWKNVTLDPELPHPHGKVLGIWKLDLPKTWALYPKVVFWHFLYNYNEKMYNSTRASSPSREGLGQLKTGPTQKIGTVPKSRFCHFLSRTWPRASSPSREGLWAVEN